MAGGGGRSRALRLTVASALVFGGLATLLTVTPEVAFASGPACATPGVNGAGGTLANVVNTYYPAAGSYAVGATSLAVGTSTGSTTAIAAGDELLVIQVQGATINTTNSTAYGANDGTGRGATAITAGTYEYVEATSAVTGGAVTIVGANGGGLLNAYTNTGSSHTEVIRVPQYATATLGSTLTASAWNGTSGGVLALDVSGTLALGSATVSLNGLGFRAGLQRNTKGATGGANTDYVTKATFAANGEKGEGYAGTPTLPVSATVDGYTGGDYGRGAPGNAGGGATDGNPTANDQNAGGGGGGNGGIGGGGGNSWSTNLATGGLGGAAFAATPTSVVLGGGGGAGSNNDNTTSSSGGAGGGLALIRAGSTSGTGTITANGANAPGDTTNDGGGGGGAGGSIIVTTPAGGSLTGLTLTANGGTGGVANSSNKDPHGPGGGGAGGVIGTSSATAASTVAGGANGTSTSTAGATIAYGATPGSGGVTSPAVSAASIPGVYSGAECVGTNPSGQSATGATQTSECAIPAPVLLNGGFETPVAPTNTSTQYQGAQATTPQAGIGWSTTDASGTLEIWSTGFMGFSSDTGTQFDELQANGYDTIYQDVATTPGTVIEYNFAHLGRLGVDTAAFEAGSPTGTLSVVKQVSDPNNKWGHYAGAYTVPAGQTKTRFAFKAVSSSGGNASAGNFIDSISINVAANACNDAYTVPEGPTATALDVLSNDQGSNLVASLPTGSTAPSHGTVTVTGTGVGNKITYTPTTGYYGTDTFTYTATDAYGNTSVATVTVTIPPPPAAPALTSTGPTPAAQTATVTVPTGGSATLLNGTTPATSVTIANQGTYTINAAGTTITFTPVAGYTGTATAVKYQVTDQYGDKASNTYTPTVTPTETNGTATVADGSSLTNVAVPTPVGTGPFTYTLVSGPANAAASGFTFNSNGTFSYTPKTPFSGTAADSFTFTATGAGGVTNTATETITVTPVGKADSYTTPFQTKLTTTSTNGVLVNDLATGAKNVTLGTNVTHGTLTLNADGTFAYTPANGYTGTDTFTYSATDASGQAYGPVTVTITIPAPAAPVANPDSASTVVNTTLTQTTSVLGNDTGTGPLTAVLNANVSHGTLTLNSDGTYKYVPTAGYSGPDSFTYYAKDAAGTLSNSTTVTLAVTPVGTPDAYTTPFNTAVVPAAEAANGVLNNDLGTGLTNAKIGTTTPSHGTVTVNTNGTFTYTPTAGYAGTDTFTYTATDSSGQAIGQTLVTITISKPAPPTAVNDTGTTPVNQTLTVATANGVLKNDTGTGTLTATKVTSPSHGTVTLNSDGSYTYVPTSGYSGPDSFTYTTSDTYGQTSAAATVNLTVTPVGVVDTYSTPFQTKLTVPVASGVLSNDLGTGLKSVTVGTTTANGTLALAADGSLTYTPKAGFTGTDTFTYTATDASGQVYGPITDTITVPAPGKPVATNDTATTPANSTLTQTTSVTSNDSGTAPLTPKLVQTTTNGTLTFNADGTYKYVPNTGFSGTDTFTYTDTDPANQTSAPATVTITVTPVGTPDSGSTPFNTPLTTGTNVLSNDAATGATVTGYTQPAFGTVTVNANGTYTYTPNATYSGTDSFTYTAKDSSGQTYGPITVSLTVGKPAAPVANNDAGTTPVNQTLTVTAANGVLKNDTGTGTLSVTKVTNPTHGTVTLNSDGSYTYVPTSGYSGPDSFTYTTSDTYGQTSAAATVKLTVTPAGVADSYTTPFNTTLTPTTGVLANDLGSTLTGATVVTSAAHGTGTLNANGTFTYTPTAGFSGVDTFTYNATDGTTTYGPTTVTITVGKPAAPTAVNDTGSTPVNQTLTVTAANGVLKNDTGTGTLTATKATNPTHGTVTLNSDGSYTYVPTSGYSGPDSFTYTTSDTYGQTSAAATVNLTVTPVGVADSYSTPFQTKLTVPVASGVLSNDLGTGLKGVAVGTTTANGTLTLATDGSFTYTPNSGFSGTDTFTYTATDGTTTYGPVTDTITVPAPGAPAAANDVNTTPANKVLNGTSVTANDSGTAPLKATLVANPTHGTVVLNTDGTYVYTPSGTYSGTDTFTYYVTDAANQKSNTATVTITVTPVGVNDSYPTAYNTADTQTPTTNDLATSPVITSVSTTSAQGGTVVLNANGTVTYTPKAGFTGTDTYTYQAKDASGQAYGPVTVTYTVAKPAAPAAVLENTTTPAGIPVSLTVLSNDSGTGTLTPTIGTGPTNGTAVVNADGTVTYTPNAGFSGTDTFTYADKDTFGQTSNTVTDTIKVTPVGVADSGSTPFNTTLTQSTSVLANDLASSPTSIAVGTQPAHGTLTLNANGTYTYVPTTGYAGTDSFTYTAKDSSGQSYGPVTVSLTVGNPAKPTAVNDTGTTPVNQTLTVTAANGVQKNDTGTGTLTSTVGTAPAHGSLTLNANGSYTYTPTTGYSGPDSFTYTDTDTYGQTSGSATVNLTVTPVGVADAYSTPFQTALTESAANGVFANDLGTGLKGAAVGTAPANGTLTAFATDGSFTYTPKAGFSGTDTFTYTATDGTGQAYGPVTVTITVPAPGKPVANTETGTTPANTTLNQTTSILANDTGTAPLTPKITATTTNGTLTLNADGTYKYVPNTGFSGTDTFSYTVTDAAGQTSAPVTDTITVTPVGATDRGTTPFNTTLNGTSVLANDAATGATVTSYTQPAFGTLTVNANGTYTYIPNATYSGTDSFTYTAKDGANQSYGPITVTLTVGKPVAPVANNDTGSTPVSQTLTVTPANGVLKNDTGTGTLTATKATNPTHGTVTLDSNGDGGYTYVPTAGYSGPDSFTYTTSDTYGQTSAPATVNLTVTPVGVADSYTTPFNTTLAPATGVLANDLGSTLSGATVATGVSHGTLSLAGNGTFSYVPTAGFAGTDTFTYNATDGTTAYGPTTVTITVGNPAAPTAVNDSASTPVNQTLTVAAKGVLANDTGTGTLTATQKTAPSHGSVTLNADGSYSYTPVSGYSGPDSFTYTTSDTYGQTSPPATVNLTVTPVGKTDAYSTPFQTKLTVPVASGVLSNDLGTGLKGVAVGTGPANGTLALAADGSFTYTPKAGFSGSDSFTYTATDGTTTYGPITVTITVPAPNAPAAANDSATTPANVTLNQTTSILGNDSGTAPLVPTLVTGTTHGTVTLNSDGTYVYAPNGTYSGPDTFTYYVTDAAGQKSNTATVTISVTPVGVADSYTTAYNTADTKTPSGNDLATSPVITSVSTTSAQGGTVVLNANGTVTYTPKAGFTGVDTYTYSAKDASGNVYGPITVSYTVAKPGAPVAVADTSSTTAGVAKTFPVLTNDSGTGTLTPTIGTGPANGTVVVNSDGTVTYTPKAGFSGTDTFTYADADTFGQTGNTVTDTVTVTPVGTPDAYSTPFNTAVVPAAEAANGVLNNDLGTGLTNAKIGTTTPSHGTVTVNTNGTFTYTPTAGYAGTDTFTYTATDSSGQAIGQTLVTITVGKPAVPVAKADSGSTTVNSPLTVTAANGVLTNDTGTGTLTPAVATQPTNGSVTLNANGSYTYTPATGFSGTDTFTYTDTDTYGQTSAPATVTITVAPKGVADSYSTQFQTPLSVTTTTAGVLGNDLGTGLTGATVVQKVSNGTLTLASNGTFTYTPANGFTGTDSFTYSATDGSGQAYGPTTVTITVPAPGAPVANADKGSTPANQTLNQTTSVLANDSGTAPLTPKVVQTTTNGTLTLKADGTFTYVPKTGFSGTDTFTYTVTDAANQTSAPATVTITVTPVGASDSNTTPFNTTLSPTTSLLANDAATGATITGYTQPSNGTVTVNSDGTYTYKPNATFAGTDTFTYTAKDSAGQTYGPITVTIAVGKPGAPSAVNDTNSTPVNTTLTVTAANGVQKNDTGTGALTSTVGTGPSHGTLTLNADGSYSYAPVSGYSGPDSFTYTDTDTYGQTSAAATVKLTVTPVGVADSYSTPFQTKLTVPVGTGILSNDLGSTLTGATVVTPAAHGTGTLNADGSFTYTPANGFTGTDSFTYNATDGTTTYGPTTVTITVTSPSGPVANADNGTTPAGQILNGTSVLTNDAGTGPLKATKASNAANGSVTVNSDGTYTYTPNAGFSGTDSFTYTTTDAAGQVSAPATVTITVTPVGTADTGTTGFNQTLTQNTSVFSNDLATMPTIVSSTNPSHGTLTLAAGGTYTYVPTTGYSGTDSFTYTAKDAANQSYGPITVTLTVGKPGAPVAVADTNSTNANTTLTVSALNGVLSNDTGTGTLTAVPVATTTHGTLTLNGDGSYSYAPTTGFSGTDTFTYKVTDTYGQTSNTVTDTITVKPTGNADTATTGFNQTLTQTTSVLKNDNGSNLTGASVATKPANGTVTLNADGTYTYVPTPGFSGTDSFTYTATDGTTTYGPTPVTISVGKPGAPVAKADSYSTVVSTTLPVSAANGVLSNDTGTGTLTATKVTDPAHGAVTLNADGSFSYTPTSGYSGTDSFTYTTTDGYSQTTAPATVTIAVTPKGVADSYTTPFQTKLTVPVGSGILSNDLGTGLTNATVVTPAAHGTGTLNADGSFTYTPANGFTGTDTFTYTATDAAGQAIPATTVTITVPAPNAPVANPDTGTTPANVTLNGTSVTTNDSGTRPLTPKPVTQPAHGTLTLNSDGTYVYVPTAGYSGPDSFTYTVTDAAGQTSAPATVSLKVTPVGSPDTGTTPFNIPLQVTAANGVLSNDAATSPAVTGYTQPAFGTVTVNTDGSYTYTPTNGYAGTDSFTYTAKDASGQTYGPITVSLTVGKPSVPVANNDLEPATPVNTAQTVTAANGVLHNDTGTGTLTATKLTNPAHGTVTLNSDGSFSYTPTAGYTGTDSFTYDTSDTYGQTSAPATVSLKVTPQGVADTYSTPFNTKLTVATASGVLANDLATNASGVSVVTNVTNGTLTVGTDGSFVYTPNTGFAGTDSFTYNATDGTTPYGPTTVTITVGKPAPPVGQPDTVAVTANTPKNIPPPGLLGNDSGTGPLTAVNVTQPTNGAVTINPDGSYTYTPNNGFSGPDSFTYVAKDSYGQTSQPVTVTVNVAPAGVADAYSTPFNTQLAVSAANGVLSNDHATGAKNASVATTTSNGTLSLLGDGSFTYTPGSSFSGTDSFTYTATDASGQSYGATVTITVPAPGAPSATNDNAKTPANTALTGASVTTNDSGTAPLVPTLVTGPANGTLTGGVINPDGTYTYTPTTGFSGTDTFTYYVTDKAGQKSNTATVTITVTPTGTPDSGSTPFNTALTTGANLVTNDAASSPTVSGYTQPAHGTVTVNANGTYVYTPAATYSGPDSFTYTASDASGQTYGPVTVTLTVGKPGVPVAVNDLGTTNVNTALTVANNGVLANDTGTGTLTAALGVKPVHGTVTLNTAGGYTYTPAAGYSGPDSFTYTATDTYGQTSAPATVNLTVKPAGVADSYTAQFNKTLTTTAATGVLANDLGATLQGATVATNVSHGTLTLNTDGSFTYIPTPGYAGPDSFTYTASDGTTTYGPITVSLTVPTPGAPVAMPDSNTTSVNTPLTVADPGVLGNDTGTGKLTATLVDSPTHGTVTVSAGGGYTYTPAGGYSGPDSFTYTATDTYGQTSAVTKVSLQVTPTGVADSYSTGYNVPLTITTRTAGVLGNDLGTALTAGSLVQAANGTVALNSNGSFTYTPNAGFIGTDTFTYVATDTSGQSTGPITVKVVVGKPGAPVAVNDSGTTTSGTALVVPDKGVLTNDTGTGPLTSTVATQPAHGTLAGNAINPGGGYTYTPAAGFSGTDTFTYTDSDTYNNTSAPATVTITVTPTGSPDTATVPFNAAPYSGASVLTNDSGTGLKVTANTNPAHGTVTVNPNGTYTYTPTTGYAGSDSFTYTATDAAGNSTGPILVTLNVGNPAAPKAVADAGTTPVNTVLTVTAANGVLSNDTGTGTLTAAQATGPKHGTLSLNPDGSYTYTPTAGYSGPDSFTYTASDTYGQTSAPATVTLTVTPVGVADTASVAYNTPLNQTTSVLANDSGTGLKVTPFTGTTANGGSLVLAADGTYTYTPATNFTGTDSFTYTATDGTTPYGPITVTLTVNKPGAPVANPDAGTTPANAPLTVTAANGVLTNDSGSGLTATNATQPKNGSVSLATNGGYVYTPATGFSGKDTFTYTATDSSGQSSTAATVTITVTPLAANDTGSVQDGSTLTVTAANGVLGNDTGTGLTATDASKPAHGTVTLNTDGSYSYTPAAGFSGTDTFTYNANDGTSKTPATVTITVSPNGVADTATAAYGVTTSSTTSVLANDLGSGPLTATPVTAGKTAQGGSYTLDAQGNYTYTPAAGFTGADTFTYTGKDANGTPFGPVTVTVTVAPPGGPVAKDDAYPATAGSPLTVPAKGVETNDTGTGTLTAVVATAPKNGTLTLNPDGSFTYTPTGTFSGTDTFTYTDTDAFGQTSAPATVTVTVKPSAVADTATTALNTPLNGTSVLANDTGSALKVTPFNGTTAGGGKLVLAADGTYTYTPATGFSGPDTYTYTVTDSSNQTATATLTINVGAGGTPDTGVTNANTPLNGTSVLANDGGTGLSVTGYTATTAKGGSVTVDETTGTATSGTYVYTPPTGFSGTDTFTYSGKDSANNAYGPVTVTITVKPVAVADTASTPAGTPITNGASLTGNDLGSNLTVTGSTPSKNGGAVKVNPDGTFSYTPPAGFSGPDTFTYTVSDGVSTATGTVTVNVAPVANPDKGTTGFNAPLNGSSVLANDFGSGLSVTAVTQPPATAGRVAVNPDGTYVFTPVNGFVGTTSFGYTLTDSSGQKATTTVSVTDLPPGPVATADSGSTTTGVTLSNGTNLLANDTGAGPLKATAVSGTSAKGGTVTVNSDGSYTYTPAAGFSGTDTFTYTDTDVNGQVSAPGTVTITVAPQAKPDSQSVASGSTLKATVPPATGSGPFTYAGPSSPTTAHGTVTFNSDGTYSYTPTAGYTGPDSFTYTAVDASGVKSAPVTISITVITPAAPIAVNDTGSTLAGQTLTNGANLLTNDKGTGTLTTAKTGGPNVAGATATVNPDGSYTYTPAAGFSGTDTFTYTTTDGFKQTSAPATVTITVVPVAVADSYQATGGQPLTVTAAGGKGLLANDLGTGLTAVNVTQPAHGTVALNGTDGSFTYTPNAGYLGDDTFTYQVKDAAGNLSKPATVDIFTQAPPAPVAVADKGTTPADQPLTNAGSLLTNDTGAPALTVKTFDATSTQGGTVSVNATTGDYSYTPPKGFSGTDTFTYTIVDGFGTASAPGTVTITVVPVAAGDSATLTGGKPYTGASVLTNDDGTKLTAVVATPPAHGTLVLNPDGTYTYTPTGTYSGPDSFTYQAKDAAGNLSPAATVTLNVVKPAPPTANADSGSTSAGQTLTNGTNLLNNDTGATPLTSAVASQPAHGTVTVNADGTYAYTPAAGFSGTDSFTYTDTDVFGQVSATPGTVTITVLPVAAPDSKTVVAGQTLTANAPAPNGTGPFTYAPVTQPAHGTLTLNPDGSYSYTPDAGFTGTDAFTYTVADAAGNTSTPVTISLNVVKPAVPSGAPDTATTKAGTPVTGASVLGNDTGTGPLTAVKASNPAHGTVTVNPNGTYTYTPAAGFSGTDSFTYTVNDSYGQTSPPVTVTVTVTPTAAADSASTPEGTTLSGASVLGNDQGTGLTATLASGPTHGTLTLNPNGTYTYTPAVGYAGPDSFTYVAKDASGQSTAPVTVSLTVVAGTPVITGGTKQTVSFGGTPAPITYTGPKGSVEAVTTAKPGSLPPGLKLTSTGSFTGTATKAGTYTFPVTVTDPAGGKTTQNVTIVVKSAPSAPAVAASTTVGTSFTLPNLGGTITKVSGNLPPGIKVLGQTLVGTSTKVGKYTVTVTISVHGKTVTRQVTITVLPKRPTQPANKIAFTGAPISSLLGWALLLLTLGAGLVGFGAIRNRRRRPTAGE